MFESEGIILQDRSTVDVVNWQWISPNSSPNQSTLTNPIMNFPQEPGTHPVTLIVESIYGCCDTVTHNLTVHSDILFFAPNSFTPDDDEYNQTWKPEITGIDIYDYELLIFNRWGEVIWENHDPSQGWDGTYEGQNVQTGTYTWKAVVSDPYDDSKKTFNGFINVLR